MTTFVPKQLLAKTPALYAELSGNVTDVIAAKFLSSIPPIPQGSVLHDNACGTGAVTKEIMATNPPAEIVIHATDVNPAMVAITAAEAAKHSWPVQTAAMPFQKLEFANETFSHSILNFAIFFPEDADAACKEIYRTLKPGGIAVATTWHDIPYLAAMSAAHEATRPGAPPLSVMGGARWKNGMETSRVLEAVGFARAGIRLEKLDGRVKIVDLGRWLRATWSFLGMPVGGWTTEDEARWDEAIEIFRSELVKQDGFVSDDAGEQYLTFVANVAIATK